MRRPGDLCIIQGVVRYVSFPTQRRVADWRQDIIPVSVITPLVLVPDMRVAPVPVRTVVQELV